MIDIKGICQGQDRLLKLTVTDGSQERPVFTGAGRALLPLITESLFEYWREQIINGHIVVGKDHAVSLAEILLQAVSGHDVRNHFLAILASDGSFKILHIHIPGARYDHKSIYADGVVIRAKEDKMYIPLAKHFLQGSDVGRHKGSFLKIINYVCQEQTIRFHQALELTRKFFCR